MRGRASVHAATPASEFARLLESATGVFYLDGMSVHSGEYLVYRRRPSAVEKREYRPFEFVRPLVRLFVSHARRRDSDSRFVPRSFPGVRSPSTRSSLVVTISVVSASRIYTHPRL